MLEHVILNALLWHLYGYLADLSGLKKQGIGGGQTIKDWIKQYLLAHDAKEETAKTIASFNWAEAVRRGEITFQSIGFLMEDLGLTTDRITFEIYNVEEADRAMGDRNETEESPSDLREGTRW